MRISIKMRTVFSVLIVLLLVLTFNVATSFAQDAPQPISIINTDYVYSVAFSPDGTTIASGSRDYTIRLWDVATGSLRNTLRRDPIEIHPVYSVVFSPDGSMIASGNGDYTVHLWNVATGSLRNTLAGHTSNIYSVAFSPDGNTLASGSQDETVRLWDVATATLRNILMGHTDIVFSVAFSPDGTTLASGSNWQDPNVRLWDANTGSLKNTLEHTNGINSVVFSPDSSTLASAESFEVRLWDANTGSLKNTLKHTANALSVAFSPDGMTIASGNGDEVRLWDAHTGTLRNTLTGHTDTVRSVAFSPDGSTLASGSGDGTVRLWQLTPTSATITFSPDGVPDQTFTVGTPVSLTLPSATGGTPPYTYTLSPIPVGLQFDAATQVLSGTPTTAISATLTTYTATDATGRTASLTFTITVQDTPPLTNVYMYWADLLTNKIQRANLDGTNVQDIVTGFGRPVGIALDMSVGKMYWTDRDKLLVSDATARSSIHRANLDGTNIETLVLGDNSIKEHIALDISNGKMYWTDWGNFSDDKIQRANLDGSNVEDLVTGLSNPRGIALDVSQGKMYWTNAGKIQRSNLDGSNIQELLIAGTPSGIALDVGSGKIYWADQNSNQIRRADFDGSNVEDVVALPGLPADIALDTVSGKMYWTAFRPTKIQRANLDGTNVEDLIITGLSNAIGIALSIPQPSGTITFNPSEIADQTFTVGTYASLNLPVATGGTEPYTYTLTPDLPTGLQFDAFDRWIGGTPTTPMPATPYTYAAMDTTGASASLTFMIEVTGTGTSNLDVNGDGQVNVIDLAIVALFYGTRVPVGVSLPADVNADGVVDLSDLIAVAEGIDAAGGGLNQLAPWEVEAALLAAVEQAAEIEAVAGAPEQVGTPRTAVSLSIRFASKNVADALAAVRTDVRFQKDFVVLEAFLALLTELTVIPETTALLPNYPNPFNPETWIPYHLSKDTEVIVKIYDIRGVVVRELMLGHQRAGVYQSRSRAAYWDGRNNSGEPVASGVYFYTLTAGDFTATRKMLIAK